MKKIKYNIDYRPLYDKYYNGSKTGKKYLYLYSNIQEFMKHNPPCKQCLVQVTCIFALRHINAPVLYIILCDKIKEFITNNKFFEKEPVTNE